jgi:hypothetical protein
MLAGVVEVKTALALRLPIYDALEINPDLKLSRLDQVLPLPPAQLPPWSGVEDAVTPESYDKPTY